MTEIKKGVVLNYLNMAIGSLIPLFYTPIMLRLLGQDEYGLYKLSGSVSGYLSLLSLGIGSAILRNLIKAKAEGGLPEEQRVFGLFLVVYKIIALIIVIVGAIIVFNLDLWYGDSLGEESLYKMQILVAIMVCQTSLSFIVGPYTSIITAHEKYAFFQLIGILLTVAGPLGNLVALYLGYASVGMAVSTLLVNIVGQLVYMHYVRYKIGVKTQYRDLPWHLLKEIFIFSFWIFFAQITVMLYNATDTLLIGSRVELGAKAVAIYSIGGMLSGMVFNFTSGINSVLAPRVNKMYFEGVTPGQMTDWGIKVARLQLYIISLFVAGFICFGRQFLDYYAGSGYKDAYWIAILTMLPYIVPLLHNVFLNVSMAQFKHQFRSIISFIIAVINVIGTYYVLPIYGIIGAAFITSIAGILGQGVIMSWYYSKKIHIEMTRFWMSIIQITVVPIICCVVFLIINWYYSYSVYTFVLSIVVFTIIYCVTQYLFIMNSYERDLIVQPFKKIVKRR